MDKDALHFYNRAVEILDHFYEESSKVYSEIDKPSNWKQLAIWKGFKQANNIMFCILSNTDISKHVKDIYVTDLIIIGSLGRIIRDLYVLIAYLKTNKYSESQMKLCWDYQVNDRKLVITKYTETGKYVDQIKHVLKYKEKLRKQIEQISFANKSSVLRGKDEKMLTSTELADELGFDNDKFYNEFIYFSQFSHATAFSNHLITDEGVDLAMFAHTYDIIVAYYVGLIYESVSLLKPSQEDLPILQEQYEEIIKKRWNVNNS